MDKPEDGKDKKAFLNKVDSLIPTKVKNMANDINEKAKETKEVVEQSLQRKSILFMNRFIIRLNTMKLMIDTQKELHHLFFYQ